MAARAGPGSCLVILRVCSGGLAIAVAALVLLGYRLDIAFLWRPIARYPAIHPITALCIVLIGASALAARSRRALTATLTAMILLTLRVLDLALHTALLPPLTPFAGVMARQAAASHPITLGINTAIGLLAAGASQLLVWRGAWTASQSLAALAAMPFAVALIGYLYGLSAFYGELAPVTAVGGTLAVMATLLAAPGAGILRPLLAHSAPGRLARFVVGGSAAVTVLVGWLIAAHTDAANGTLLATEVVVMIVFVTTTVALGTVQFDRSDQLRLAQEIGLAQSLQAQLLTERRLARETRILQTTLDEMEQGIIMVDAAGTIVLSNQRVVALLDLPPALMASTPRFADVLAHQRRQGEFDNADAGLLELIRAGGLLDHAHGYERTRPNGRVVEVRSVTLPGGGVVRTFSDITERRAAEERIRYFAHHDDLTRVANRKAFVERLADAIGLAGRSGRCLTVHYLDLDRFKQVNDLRGHHAGDALLAQLAARIVATVRDIDTVARMGGDEFAIVQSLVDQPLNAATSLAQRLVATLSAPYDIEGQQSCIGVSIGISIYPRDGATPDVLLHNADTALYRAKAEGRGTFRFFEPGMDTKLQQRALLERDLREAVTQGLFTLAYQPVCDTASGEVLGFESLLRWMHPARGPMAPMDFVPVAEECGLIVPLGRWVLQTACAEAATWERHVRVAVNLSPVQFHHEELQSRVADILLHTGLDPARLELEVTEGVLLEHSRNILDTMKNLKRHGIGLTLDDFGTANAGLSYLRMFPFDRVKIDRSFIQNIDREPDTLDIVRAILMLCEKLHIKVVAEGVETAAQLQVLQSLNCPAVQGYFTGRPMASRQVHELLSAPAGSLVAVAE